MDELPPSDPPTRPRLELALVEGDAIVVVRLPESGSVTLGRAEDCDVPVDNRSVSRHHAVLHLGPPLSIEDLGSANGTFVRDTRRPVGTGQTFPLLRLSKQRVQIAVGERINVGSTTVVVRRSAGSPSRKADAAQRGASPLARDPAMAALYEQAGRAARSTVSVLILGETGVGKEVLARTIHAESPRADRPFVEIHCAALAPSLLEGELFGHEKSAFTGATQARAGLIESADGGTVFLDEVGELPLAVQVKLLRVLEDRKVLRLGGRTPKQLDVRFIAATNRDLPAEIARGTFRQDLYFRLDGVSFVIPPLRERPAEIAPLAERFLLDGSRQLDRPTPLRLSPEALRCLERYSWPGNVRELRNVIERAIVLTDGDTVTPDDLPEHISHSGVRPSPSGRAPAGAGSRPPPAGDEERRPPPDPKGAERERIVAALEQCAGNQTRAAKLLGMPLRTLVKRLGELDVPRPRKRP